MEDVAMGTEADDQGEMTKEEAEEMMMREPKLQRRSSNGDADESTTTTDGCGTVMNLCMFLVKHSPQEAESVQIYSVDMDLSSSSSMGGGGCLPVVRPITVFKPRRRPNSQLRLASVASRLVVFNHTEDANDVGVCQLFRRSGGGGTIFCGVWEKGPRLREPKPNPLLATVNGKLYVLSVAFNLDYDKNVAREGLPEQTLLGGMRDLAPEEKHLVFLPVKGLESLTDKMPKSGTEAIVTHPVKSTYCVLVVFPNVDKPILCMRVCTFDIEEGMDTVNEFKGSSDDKPPTSIKHRFFQAKNVVSQDF